MADDPHQDECPADIRSAMIKKEIDARGKSEYTDSK